MYEIYFTDKNDQNKKYIFKELDDKYVHQTAVLLNTEWPRSMCQRHLSLKATIKEKSDKLKLPVSLIIIDLANDQVVGHANIASITTIDSNESEKKTQNLAFLQSVIIDKNLRGKGLGKQLMNLSEGYLIEYSKQQERNSSFSLIKTNCDCIYLNTKDKQSFYESLGYIQIKPILFYANKDTKCNQIMKNLLSKMSSNSISTNSEQQIPQTLPSLPLINVSAPLPPPPPFSQKLVKAEKSTDERDSKNMDLTWYKKFLNKKSI